MVRPELALIIPALNEAATIGQIVKNVIPFGLPIVVDDGSSDDTASIAGANGAVVVRHRSNLGYDQALASGFEKAKELHCQYVITIDGDGQHDPHVIPAVLGHLRGGADVVFGRRAKMQRPAEFVFGKLSLWLYGVSDPLCGLKGYSVALYADRGVFTTYDSAGTDLAFFALRQQKTFKEVFVPIHARRDAPRFGRATVANFRILKAALRTLLQHFRQVKHAPIVQKELT